MTGTAPGETPQLGIFWLVQTSDGVARLLTAGCPLDQAEPYGDCLTYGPGHYETWRTGDVIGQWIPLYEGISKIRKVSW
jgi:hypothetical protein